MKLDVILLAAAAPTGLLVGAALAALRTKVGHRRAWRGR